MENVIIMGGFPQGPFSDREAKMLLGRDRHGERSDFPRRIDELEAGLVGIPELDARFEVVEYAYPSGTFRAGQKPIPRVVERSGLAIMDVNVNGENHQIGYIGSILEGSIGHRIFALKGVEYCRSGLVLERDNHFRTLEPVVRKDAPTIMVFESIYDKDLGRWYNRPKKGTGTGH